MARKYNLDNRWVYGHTNWWLKYNPSDKEARGSTIEQCDKKSSQKAWPTMVRGWLVPSRLSIGPLNGWQSRESGWNFPGHGGDPITPRARSSLVNIQRSFETIGDGSGWEAPSLALQPHPLPTLRLPSALSYVRDDLQRNCVTIPGNLIIRTADVAQEHYGP